MQHKYQAISQIIENNITNNHYSGPKLPTEEELIKEFSVSRNTLRKAIDVLVRKGYIMPVQGSGMFIRDISHTGAINLENFRGLTEDYKNHSIKTQVIEFKTIEATEELAEIMQCDVGTSLYFVNRLRVIDDIPWVIEYSYFNKRLIPYLNQEILEGSIYEYIRTALQKPIGYVDRILEARALNAVDAKLLGLQEGNPSLISTNKAMFKTGEIFDYSIDIHNYQHTRFLKLSNFMY